MTHCRLHQFHFILIKCYFIKLHTHTHSSSNRQSLMSRTLMSRLSRRRSQLFGGARPLPPMASRHVLIASVQQSFDALSFLSCFESASCFLIGLFDLAKSDRWSIGRRAIKTTVLLTAVKPAIIRVGKCDLLLFAARKPASCTRQRECSGRRLSAPLKLLPFDAAYSRAETMVCRMRKSKQTTCVVSASIVPRR